MRSHLIIGFAVLSLVSILLVNITESQVNWSLRHFDEYKVDNFTAALWHFNEGKGNFTKDETGINNGTIKGNTNWTKGKFKKALSMGGVMQDVVLVPDNDTLDITTAGTLEAWVEPKLLGKGVFIAKATSTGYNQFSYYFRFTGAGPGSNPNTLAIIFDNNGVQQQISGNIPLLSGKFQHIAVTWNGTTVNLYVNGILDVSVPQRVIPDADIHPLYLGPIGGTIDEVRISNKARDPSEFNV